jgi:hypothetical protein
MWILREQMNQKNSTAVVIMIAGTNFRLPLQVAHAEQIINTHGKQLINIQIGGFQGPPGPGTLSHVGIKVGSVIAVTQTIIPQVEEKATTVKVIIVKTTKTTTRNEIKNAGMSLIHDRRV